MKQLLAAVFIVVLEGEFLFQQGIYDYIAVTENGIRLFVDGQPVIEQWTEPRFKWVNPDFPASYGTSVVMTEGLHRVRLEENADSAGATLQWGLASGIYPNAPSELRLEQ